MALSISLTAAGCAGREMTVPIGQWGVIPSGPVSARYEALCLWTGTAMFVWGGTGPCGSSATCGDGGLYRPLEAQWEMIPSDLAVAARTGHRGVWTGDSAIVWGGKCGDRGVTSCGDGGIFTPADGVWRALAGAGSPSPRVWHSAVWTGTEMIIWGGQGTTPNAPIGDGGRYSTADSAWVPVPATGAPSPRRHHTAVWTGTEMIVWGGDDMPERYHQLGDGARYHPGDETWRPVTVRSAPRARYLHGAVWTGQEMIVWGGLGCGVTSGGDPVPCDDGARYDPRADTWTPISREGAPAARSGNIVIWTGAEMIVWGGLMPGSHSVADGAVYDPAKDRWRPMNPVGAPAGRDVPGTVWAGDRLLIWGGVSAEGELPLDDGAQYSLEP
jgi:hypothetical protein